MSLTIIPRSSPKPREKIAAIYWYFASERQRIFERRVAGIPRPWTQDPILQTFKFCNVFRAADRVSQYMVREVACSAERVSPEDRIFQIVAFRTFSKEDTWNSIRLILGRAPTLDDLRDGAFAAAVNKTRLSLGGLYTAAFILCASPAYGHTVKHLNHLDLFKDMFLKRSLAQRIQDAPSLASVFDLLRSFPLMGDFMSYQIAIDLNYSSLLPFSENEFTRPGPGAVRGIRKVFTDIGDYSPSDVISWMVDRQADEFAKRNLPFTGLWGRPLQAIDCQGLFCEVDKYCREAVPSLSSARVRIKTRFKAASIPLTLMFPPKWGINDLIPKRPVLGPDQSADGPASLQKQRAARSPVLLKGLSPANTGDAPDEP
jgi:hypothetical protein